MVTGLMELTTGSFAPVVKRCCLTLREVPPSCKLGQSFVILNENMPPLGKVPTP